MLGERACNEVPSRHVHGVPLLSRVEWLALLESLKEFTNLVFVVCLKFRDGDLRELQSVLGVLWEFGPVLPTYAVHSRVAIAAWQSELIREKPPDRGKTLHAVDNIEEFLRAIGELAQEDLRKVEAAKD